MSSRDPGERALILELAGELGAAGFTRRLSHYMTVTGLLTAGEALSVLADRQADEACAHGISSDPDQGPSSSEPA
jgi:hypothetical protein